MLALCCRSLFRWLGFRFFDDGRFHQLSSRQLSLEFDPDCVETDLTLLGNLDFDRISQGLEIPIDTVIAFAQGSEDFIKARLFFKASSQPDGPRGPFQTTNPFDGQSTQTGFECRGYQRQQRLDGVPHFGDQTMGDTVTTAP